MRNHISLQLVLRQAFVSNGFFLYFVFVLRLQSILGKMKCSVSKMLPNSISKWLSPKVDAQNSRRRRHDDLDSEEEDTEQNRSLAFGNVPSSLVSRSNNFAQGSAVTVAAAPPTKRQRIFTVSFPVFP